MRDMALAAASGTHASSSALVLKDAVIFGFDFGARRIGVAVGNRVTRRARPMAVIDATGERRWQRIGELIASWQPAHLVVGIARSAEGAAHELTARCERFARQLEGRFRLPVARVDERYSSVVVGGGRDDEAAAVILQQWFDEQGDLLVPDASGKSAEGKRP
jgi:putative Holliday junction resolvase